MGVFAHEYGHGLGLPDLYDTDKSSKGTGDWDLMAGGSWNKVSRGGDRPAHLSAWCKYKLGWVNPTVVIGKLENEQISAASNQADVYRLLTGSPGTGGEYFLIENRQQSGFDEGLPGAGLAVWHIDESKADNTQECKTAKGCPTAHYRVALEQRR
jgi:M6 family metalloprotease-like protein